MTATQEKRPLGRISLTERIDRVATHPVSGLFILLLVCASSLTGLQHRDPAAEIVGGTSGRSRHNLVNTHLSAPAWVKGLLANRHHQRVGTVDFYPILMLFFRRLGFYGRCRYTARAAFVTDSYAFAGAAR